MDKCKFVSKSGPEGYTFTFTTYNFCIGMLQEKHDDERYKFAKRVEHILNEIETLNSDVLVLQECRKLPDDSSIIVFFAALRKMGYTVQEFRVNSTDLSMKNVIAFKNDKFLFGNAETLWLSSTPVKPSADFGWGHVVGTCLLFPIKDGKTHSEHPVIVAVTHFSLRHEDKMFEAKKLWEIRETQWKGIPWIIGGDFNTFDDEENVDELLNALSKNCDDFSSKEGTWLGYPIDHPIKRGETGAVLDHIFAKGMDLIKEAKVSINQIYEFENENFCASDHAPVTVEVKPNFFEK